MIGLIDYGLGNINAFLNVFKRLNIEAKSIKDAADLQGVSKIVLPGVGAFDHAMNQLNSSGLRQQLDDLVLARKMPVIGICVGMQMLGNRSDEGNQPGLGWIDGEVLKFDESLINQTTKLPHMGWNDVTPVVTHSLFQGLEKDAIFYFLHSYFFKCNQPVCNLATATYGVDFACAVHHENIYGVQFHPEKSHGYGERLLYNFAKL